MTENQMKYNEHIKKLEQAEQFLYKNQKHPKIMDYLSKFQNACSEVDAMIKKIEKELGREMTSEEVLNGFK